MRTWAIVAALVAVPGTAAEAYTLRDARFVRPTGDAQQLGYIVCLQDRMKRPRNIAAELEAAARHCAKLAPPDAEDIQQSILECGFKRGDGSRDRCG